jgi:RNA polymerase sigma-70 factor (TIGR02957 family)
MTAEPAAAEEIFQAHHGLLFAIAYEMLASTADAEDVVQETWLRWSQVAPDEVSQPRAYLARTTTRLALNRLRTAQRRRETYVGPWLPEPLLTAPDVADDVELAEAVSLALLVVLESLSPLERAVFVLREVFAFTHDEIAAALDRSPAAVRQLAHRAREHVLARRPLRPADPAQHAVVLSRFMAAAAGGDLDALMDVLAPDAVLLSDGGGRVKAALRPVIGADKVARLIQGLAAQQVPVTAEVAPVNGALGILLRLPDGTVDTVVAISVDGGRVATVYLVRNPDKLSGLAPHALSR